MSFTNISYQDQVDKPEDGIFAKQDNTQELNNEHKQENIPNEVTYPEGGARAWAVAVGATLAIFTTFGWANAWGVFQEYYITHQLRSETPSALSWIGSLQIFFQFAGMLFGGPLFDKYGEKVLWAAAPCFLLAIFLTSVCKEYYQFMLAQGILGGIGMGLTMAPCFAATSHWFNKNRGAALGLVAAGSSIGGVVWPIVLNKLFQSSISFGWSIRICAFAMLAILLVAIPPVKARLPPRKGALLLPRAFKNIQYDMLILAVFLSIIGVFIPIFYLPTYAVEHGMSSNLSFYLASIVNGASFFGRVIPGITADRFGPFNMLFAAAASTGILILCWPSATTNAGIIVFAVVFGFCSGAIVSLMSLAFTRVPQDPRQIGTYLGMGMMIVAIAALIGPPINGALVTRYHGFREASIFSGVLGLAGGFVVILAKLATGKGLFAKV